MPVIDKKTIFEDLFKRHFKQLYAHALGWLQDEESAKDIVHDAFCYLWEHLERYDNVNLLSLLYKLVQSRCVNHIRQNQAKDNYIQYQQFFSDDEVIDYELYEKRVAQIMKRLEELPPQTRRVFTQCVLYKKKYKEVAELYDISPLTVKTLVARAFKTLRKQILFFF